MRGRSMPTSPSLNGKVIIICAITGSIHTPSMSHHLPVTPNDIVDSVLAALMIQSAHPSHAVP